MTNTFASAQGLYGPSAERQTFLKRVALHSFISLLAAAIIGVLSTWFIAPFIYNIAGGIGATVFILATFALSHYLARGMVYGEQKQLGLALAIIGEGTAMGFILLSTVLNFGIAGGIGLIGQCLGLTAATAFGMLMYVWFNKSDFSKLKAGLAMVGLPMIILMVVQVVWPVGGIFGLVLSAAFVLISAAGLLLRMNVVVHEMESNQHIEASYEITMGILVLFWNLLSLLNRVNRN